MVDACSHGHKFIPLILVPPDQIVGRNYRLRTIRPHRAMPAIMQQDHVATTHLSNDLSLDF